MMKRMLPRKIGPLPIALVFAVGCLTCVSPVRGQLGALGAVQAEIERSERQIREIRVEIGNRYEKKLLELRTGYQKAADLENALVIRGEQQRLTTEVEQPLSERNVIEEPRALKEAQLELLQKQSEMIAQVVQISVPKLVEVKKSLTVAGKLDEAVEVRAAIARLQEVNAPARTVSNNTAVTADEVVREYQASRERADTLYKGPRLLIRGKVAGVRPDPRDPSASTLVLFGGAEGVLVDCAFSSADYRVREERVGQNVVYVVARTNNDPNVLRLTRGAQAEFYGKYDGAEGVVRFTGCSLSKR